MLNQPNPIQGISKGLSSTSTPLPLPKEPNSYGGIRPSGINGQSRQQSQSIKTQEEMLCSSHILTKAKGTHVEFGASKDGVAKDGSRKLVGTSHSQQARDPINAQKRKEINTSDFQPSINLANKQINQMQHGEKHHETNQLGRAEIEKLIDKVLEENPDAVPNFKNPKRRKFAHCFMGGMVFTESNRKAEKVLLRNILWEKLFATLQ